jgi:YidC/Oxa1 family membrane protein insertase
MNDQKNLIIAIVASVLIMVGFQYFVEKPKLENARQQQAESTQPQTPGASRAPQAPAPAPGAPDTAAPGTGAPTAPSAQRPGVPAAPAAPTSGAPAAPGAPTGGKPVITGPRVDIGSKSLRGSIALTGGAIDDIVLKGYRETLKPESENIRLFAPSGGPGAYYAEHGWFATDPQIKVPGPDTRWTASGGTLAPGNPVTLTWDNGAGLRFMRTYAVDDNTMFTVTQRVENTGNAAVTLAPYALVNRTGTPATQGFYILHEGPLGVFNDTLEEFNYDDVAEAKQIAKTSTGGWIGITDKYWLAALVPATDAKINARFLHWRTGNEDKYQVDFSGEARAVPPGGSADTKSYLFSGAKEVRVLDGYSESLGIKNFDLAIDFGWFYFLTKPFFYLLDILSGYLGNFGLAILAVTVLVKLLFFPLANKSYKSMSAMKKLQPKMMEIKERFGNDKQRMNQEVMELYRREKVNPASSCLPIVIQIPVFFALYKVLFVSIEMRHAPFYGWVKDLSAPDPTSFINLFGLLPFAVPDFIPHFISIGAWPIIMGVLMFLQMKLNPPPPDPVQARIFMLMPIFFTFIMAPFPAGLVIYWAWNNLLSISQQWYIMKRMEKASGQTPGKASGKAPGK